MSSCDFLLEFPRLCNFIIQSRNPEKKQVDCTMCNVHCAMHMYVQTAIKSHFQLLLDRSTPINAQNARKIESRYKIGLLSYSRRCNTLHNVYIVQYFFSRSSHISQKIIKNISINIFFLALTNRRKMEKFAFALLYIL